jgi:hypothetical protein
MVSSHESLLQAQRLVLRSISKNASTVYRGVVNRDKEIEERETINAGLKLIQLDSHVRRVEQQNRGQHYFYLISNRAIATLQNYDLQATYIINVHLRIASSR